MTRASALRTAITVLALICFAAATIAAMAALFDARAPLRAHVASALSRDTGVSGDLIDPPLTTVLLDMVSGIRVAQFLLLFGGLAAAVAGIALARGRRARHGSRGLPGTVVELGLTFQLASLAFVALACLVYLVFWVSERWPVSSAAIGIGAVLVVVFAVNVLGVRAWRTLRTAG